VLKQSQNRFCLILPEIKISLPGFDDAGLPTEGMITGQEKIKKWGFADMDRQLKIPCHI